MLFYRAALPLSRKTLHFVAGIIRRHRACIGSLWRKLNPGQQALLVLAHLRKYIKIGKDARAVDRHIEDTLPGCREAELDEMEPHHV